MMHDQKGPAGNKTTVGTILTRADHGNSEDGVLGFTLQPGFDLADPNKRNVFAYYSPRPGPGDNWPIVATPAAQVVGYNQISRFTLTADGTAVVPDSERVILRVPKAKIGGSPSGFPGGPTDSGPGHVGGAGLDFDSAGNLYLGVGDDVSPNAQRPQRLRADGLPLRRALGRPQDVGQHGRPARQGAAHQADAGRHRVRTRRPASASTYSIPDGQPVRLGHGRRRVPRSTRWASASRSRCTRTRRTRASSASASTATTRPPTAPSARRPARASGTWSTRPANQGWPFCVGDQSPANTM